MNVIQEGKTQDNTAYVIRYPELTDVRSVLAYINKLSKERTFTRNQGEKFTYEEEEKYVQDRLKKITGRKSITLFLIVNETVQGICDVNLGDKTDSHVGTFALSIDESLRGKGLGETLMQATLNEAIRNLSGLCIVVLKMKAPNLVARSLYTKLGFKEYGHLPRGTMHRGEFVDEILMYLPIYQAEGNESVPTVREHYINALGQIVPCDEQERIDIEQTLAWLQSAEYVHKHGSPEQHLGVLTLLISPDKTSVFLTNHRKAQMWLPPGGHVDENVRFQDAVKEELREELSTEADFISDQPFFHVRTLTQGANAGHTDVTFWFLMNGDPAEQYKILEKEASEAKWFTIDEILANSAFSHLHRGLRKF